MLLDVTADQEFFRATTEKFLHGRVPADEIRRLHRTETGFDPEYWRRGADLGWMSLLVDEAAGGGTISGDPVAEFTMIAYEFGRHAAPGPLIPANVVAAALQDARTHPQVVAGLVSGGTIATWCHAEPLTPEGFGAVDLEIRPEGTELVLDGVKTPVEHALSARYLLVTGRTGDGLTQVLVPADSAGISIAPLNSIDLTRRFATVTFDGVRVPADAAVGAVGGAARQIERQLHLALAGQCAEMVGAMQTGFDMTMEWAADRYSFGRPLASYQALKHRFADLKSWLEAAHAIADSAAAALDTRAADSAEIVSAAKAFIGIHSVELLQDCIQLHGGIGLTFEHDLHLYLRRATVDRGLYGTPADHRQLIAERLAQREGLA
ncbi:acyl-CoA dehydrogenase family protein [Nocardia miyunensis]|uniref:acyl-CoA dehydrogenase family protein n=1 Tax=Nocardia miyunensis TaxID=282684 RepID=UPI00082CC14F|nr:acyl-CoA dehydrogenase family protein [Nocardia miyunensis]